MSAGPRREPHDLPHSRPGSVDQQSEDTFPASDAPSFSNVIIGAPSAKREAPRAIKRRSKIIRRDRAKKSGAA
jgi:hypothetical protein